MDRVALIMAGGSGSRFWPLSTAKKPKQFLKLTSDKTMIQETVERINKIIPIDKIFIATNITHMEEIKKEIPNLPDKNLILEPMARDTAACIAYSSLIIEKQYPESIMVVLPSDHIIMKEKEFLDALDIAFEVAKDKVIVTLGIKPTYPETGYGYIEYWKKDKNKNVCDVKSFREKPNLETAEKYLESKSFLWNSGMFIWKTNFILEEIKKYMPTHKKVVENMESKMDKDIYGLELSNSMKDIFCDFEKISIDFGVLEKSENVKVIPVDIGWNDVGSFKSLENIYPKDENNNVIKSKRYCGLDSEDNIIINKEKKLIATIGLEDFVIVNTKDALLICHKDKTQEIKKIFDIVTKESE